MTELIKLIHTQQEDEDDILITDRHITLDRTMHLYGEAVFENCDFVVVPHNNYRFILEKAAYVTFENCCFVGTPGNPVAEKKSPSYPSAIGSMLKAANGGAFQAIISGEEDSSMTFLNCQFENAGSILRSEGEVSLQGCEIRYTGDMAFETKEIRFISADGEEVKLTGCTVDCEEGSGYDVKLSAEHGELCNCTLKGVGRIDADVMQNCTFENCTVISLQTEDGNNEAADCRFTGCSEILAMNADFSDCEISGLRDDFAADSTTVTRCTFRNLTPDGSSAIHLEKTQMDDCIFENITLKNDYYLIDADNDSSLDDCTFKKCRTTRDDLQLVSTGGYKNRLSRKWIEEDICTDCTGLDNVIHLENWEV